MPFLSRKLKVCVCVCVIVEGSHPNNGYKRTKLNGMFIVIGYPWHMVQWANGSNIELLTSGHLMLKASISTVECSTAETAYN